MDGDLRSYFFTEARELVEQLTLGVLHVERSGGITPEQRRHLLRLAHTLKGAARVVQESAIADAAHAIEDLIGGDGGALPRSTTSRILELLDTITAALPTTPGAAESPVADTADDQSRVVRVDLPAIDGALERVADIGARCAALRDDLASGGGPATARYAVALEALVADVAQLRDHLHEMRLAPASTLFVAIERAIRDGAQAIGRSARFSATGGEHRLDADVLIVVRDALIQLARNAVAHGIEPAHERIAAGKAAEATVTLTVERVGADVAFTVSDDGRGLDVEALRAVARRTLGRAAADDELVDVLLQGGLSSTAPVSQLSGRGVGLDVVRSAVSRLNGHVSLRHGQGRGVAVTLRVPVSLRSLRYLRLEGEHGAMLLPLDAVRGTLRVADARPLDVDGRPHLVVGGRSHRRVSLEAILSGRPATAAENVVALVAAGTEAVALTATRFGEVDTAIVQALPPLSAAAATVRGLAVDEHGHAVPVLNPEALPAVAAQASADGERPRRVPRVLVIDDSITTRMLEQSILEGAGFEVHTASSAEEALTRAAADQYDLFIVDVEMPGMSGLQFVRTTRSDPALERIPAILVTSRAAAADRRAGLDAGASAYIVKGEFDQETFVSTVKGLVG